MNQNFWNTVQGQDRAKDTLLRIFNSGKIPHAFIFSGQEGVGKYNVALNFAVLLNQDPSKDKSDASAEKKIYSLQEPYIKYIIPLPRGKNETSEHNATERLDKDVLEIMLRELENKIKNPFHRIVIPNANLIKINSIREIRKFLAFNFDEVRYRIIIISDADLMNDESQNALLKSLEEPPPGVIFILLTSKLHQLKETIISRCWMIVFESLSEEVIADILVSRFEYDQQTAVTASRFSGGSIYNAIDLIDNNLKELLEKAVQVLRFSLAMKYHSALKEINDLIASSSRERVLLFLNLISLWLNDILKNRTGMNDYYFKEYTDTLIKFNEKFRRSELAAVYSRVNRLASSLDNNVNLNVIALNLIFELASLRY